MRILRGPSPSVRDSSIASSINRPIRRVLPPPRRPPSGSRPAPTPPPSYLRPWMKRRNISTTSNTESKDSVSEENLSKQKLLNQTSSNQKMSDSVTKEEDSRSTETALETSTLSDATPRGDISHGSKRNKESVRIKKIMKRIGTRPPAAATSSSKTADTLTAELKLQNQDKHVSNISDSTETLETGEQNSKQTSNENYSVVSLLPSTSVLTKVKNISPTTTTLTPFTSPSKLTTVTLPTTTAPYFFKTTIIKPKYKNTTLVDELSTVKPSLLKIIRRRPVGIHNAEISRIRKRPVLPTRKTIDISKGSTNFTSPTKIDTDITTSSKSLVIPTSRSASSVRKRNSTASDRPLPKIPDWLQRRRESLGLLREINSNKQKNKQKVNYPEKNKNADSIIDRVLYSASSQNSNDKHTQTSKISISNFSSVRLNANRKKSVNNRYPNTTFAVNVRRESNDPFYNLPLTATEPSTKNNGFSFRHRIPLKIRRPIVSNPVKPSTSFAVPDVYHPSSEKPTSTTTEATTNTFSTITTTTDSTTRTTTPDTTTTTTTGTTTTTTTTTTAAANTTKDTTDDHNTTTSTITLNPEQKILTQRKPFSHYAESFVEGPKHPREPYSTNFITTSTPKLPFDFPTNPSPKPKRHNTFRSVKGVRSHLQNSRQNGRISQTTRLTPPVPYPRMKSPQDIVLEKLSELMKNATGGGRDNLEMIIEEIEKLNKELASMGIHIIDAEFDGHKIKLKDQINPNGGGVNLSGATTIRYFIPNTKSRSRIKNPQPEIIKYKSGEDGVSEGSSSTSSNEKSVDVKHVKSSPPNQDNSQSTLSPNTQLFTLRHPNHSTAILTFPSTTSPSVTIGLKMSSSPIPSRNVDDSNESSEVLSSEVHVKLNARPDRENLTSEISATTTQSTDETTRTRTTLISFNTPKNTENSSVDTSQTLLRSDHMQNKLNNVSTSTPSVKITYVNPTAHLRPSVSGDSSESSRVTTAAISPIEESPEPPSNSEIWNNNDKPKVVEGLDNPFPLLVSEHTNTLGSEPSENVTTEDSNSHIYLIGILGIVPCIAIIAVLYKQRQKRKNKSLPEREECAEGLTPPTNHTRSAGHNDTLDAFPGYVFESSPQRDSPWELSRSKLRLTSVIGEGNFGIVWKAEARNLCDWDGDGGPTVLVAVKGVKEGACTKEKSDLLRELSIMQHLGQHSNIVTLLGCCTTQEPTLLVMEYVMFGKLLTFLREQRSKNNCFNFSSDSEHLTSRDLTKFACQIATGCEYLQSRGVIHRDLAARNILVDHNKVCKIADFGLARSVKDMDNDIYEQKSKGPLPIRWMAPESLFMNIFTHKSDVWSFGILCWEVVTLGSTPYPGISAREVMRRVREGYRLERPEHCRPEFYRIVTKCWHQDMNKRASFTTVKEDIRDLLDNYTGWIDLENFQDSTYYSMHQNNEEKL